MALLFICLLIVVQVHSFAPRVLPQHVLRTPQKRLAARTPQLLDERVIKAVEAMPGRRVTAADAATKSGMSLDEAKTCLVALAGVLASEEGVALEVDSCGEVAFSFPANVRSSLRRTSRRERWRMRWRDKIKPVAGKVGRTLFGVGLVVNVAVVWTMIAAMSSSSSSKSSDGEDRDRPSSYSSSSPLTTTSRSRMPRQQGGGLSFTVNAVDVLNIVRFSDRSRYYDTVLRGQAPPKMGTLEAVYSFVFGDGDPNKGLADRQLACAAEAIRRAGGVVAAEELAPWLLDPPPLPPLEEKAPFDDRSATIFSTTTTASQNIQTTLPPLTAATALTDTSTTVNEQWLLPVVTALGGVPEVTEDGDIVYIFEDVLSTGLLASSKPTGSGGGGSGGGDGSAAAVGSKGAVLEGSAVGVLEEVIVPFSNAPPGSLALAAGLGVADLAGVLVLGRAMAKGLAPAGFSRLFWPLFTYALSVNAAPLAREVARRRTNAAIKDRNQRRLSWRNCLSNTSTPSSRCADDGTTSTSALARKLLGARLKGNEKRFAVRSFGAEDDGDASGGVVFNSAEDLAGSATAVEAKRRQLIEFDQRLGDGGAEVG